MANGLKLLSYPILESEMRKWKGKQWPTSVQVCSIVNAMPVQRHKNPSLHSLIDTVWSLSATGRQTKDIVWST